ncbi:MAG TPA: hypothetical protein VF353_04175, partial [Candidatus Binatia bacterium]
TNSNSKFKKIRLKSLETGRLFNDWNASEMNIKPEEVTPTVDALGFDVASSSATRLIKFYRHRDLPLYGVHDCFEALENTARVC